MNLIPKMPNSDSTYGKLQDTTAATILRFWPIILAGALTLVSLGGIYVKVDYIAKIIDKNDAQMAVMNDRQNLTSQSIIEIRGQVANISDANMRNSSGLADVNRKVDILMDKSRWSPK